MENPPLNQQIRDAFTLAWMQFLSWGICTVSWRAVSQANIQASIITDTTLATLQFFVLRKIVKTTSEEFLVPWLGYTIGGVLGTICGIYFSLAWLGK